MADPIDPRVDIGHVHLKVADLDRALAFYSGILGFQVTARMGPSAAFLSAGGYHHHIGLNTWESRNGSPPPPGTTGLYHVAIRYPDRRALADALRRLVDAGVPLDGASDHGVSEALYVHDPDGNGLELYWDRPRDRWPHGADGSLQMITGRLDVDALLAEARRPQPPDAPAAPVPLSAVTRARLADLRVRLLALHKTLLDDARTAYEMDRGRIGSAGMLLQLVIHDPWFAWLRQLSELVVRIDEMTAADSVATDADAKSLFEHVDRLLVPNESGDAFARRYDEALQRQPAVVLAHGDVKRLLKAAF
ncbi:MAG TPA: VOC family protein [Vicinamibacterales bacterium]|jgi:catechol 2,3-dioxygenase|nr:VOC family protein [Vicinamibacterales bacterium]